MTSITYHYLAIGRLGRGEVVNLFLKDAGIKYDDIRYPMDGTWPATRQKLKDEGITRTGQLPSVQYKGHTLTHHLPTLRYLARELGSYDGTSSIELYQVDAVGEIYSDWRAEWVANMREPSDKYKNETVPEYYRTLALYYNENASGPYLLGDRITYADFAVYQSIDNDERIGVKVSLPEPLIAFRKAFESRSNIASYIEENKIKE